MSHVLSCTAGNAIGAPKIHVYFSELCRIGQGSRVISLDVVELTSSERSMAMQFALLIYESPEASEIRNNDATDSHTCAWRRYSKARVEPASSGSGDPLRLR